MRTNIEIDHALMEEARKASKDLATKKQTVDQALRLMIKLRKQQEVGEAFGKYRWSRQSRPQPPGTTQPGDRRRQQRLDRLPQRPQTRRTLDACVRSSASRRDRRGRPDALRGAPGPR